MLMISTTVYQVKCSDYHTRSEEFIAGGARKNCINQPDISHVETTVDTLRMLGLKIA
jgi:hypothetical protein